MKLLKITAAVIISVLVALGVWGGIPPIECVTPKDEYQLNTIQTALKLFYIDTNRFPTNEEGLLVLVGGGDDIKGYRPGGYIDELSEDRWGNAYLYYNSTNSNGVETATIATYGSDESPGGEEEQKDIFLFLEADKIFSKAQQ